MDILAQSTLQPEAIAVVVVLAVATLSLVAVAAALVHSRRRSQRIRERLAADQPDPSRFASVPDVDTIAAADSALYERDGRTVAAAALHLHAQQHPQALPYLLHALRLVPAHQRQPLIDAAAAHGPEELAEHPLLAAALEPSVEEWLRDAVQGTPPPDRPRRARVGRTAARRRAT